MDLGAAYLQMSMGKMYENVKHACQSWKFKQQHWGLRPVKMKAGTNLLQILTKLLGLPDLQQPLLCDLLENTRAQNSVVPSMFPCIIAHSSSTNLKFSIDDLGCRVLNLKESSGNKNSFMLLSSSVIIPIPTTNLQGSKPILMTRARINMGPKIGYPQLRSGFLSSP